MGMQPTTSGTFRVFPGRDETEWLLVELGTQDPTYVPREGAGEVEPGYRVTADIVWSDDGDPQVADLDVETTTRLSFARTPDIFDEAQSVWQAARQQEAAIYPQTTYDTDGEVNGVIYVFAEQDGEKDVFAEFQDGRMTLEPLIDRLGEGGVDPPYEVFVLDPQGEPFVVVYLALEKGGLLANTVRDEYF